MSEPTTEAGRRLLRSDFDTTGWGPSVVRRHVTKAVAAIEAEAVAAERKRLAEAVRELDWDGCGGYGCIEEQADRLSAVLALLEDRP